MSFCCENTEVLCSIGSCDSIDLGAAAPIDGTYTLEWFFAGNIRSQDYDFTAGDPLIFPNDFNESGVTVFQLWQPDGELFKGQCYQIQVYPKYVN